MGRYTAQCLFHTLGLKAYCQMAVISSLVDLLIESFFQALASGGNTVRVLTHPHMHTHTDTHIHTGTHEGGNLIHVE